MMRAEINHQHSGGYALISVLWLVALLTVMATGLAYAGRQHLLAVSGTVGGTQAGYLAAGAGQLVFANLLQVSPSARLLADGETLSLDLPGGLADVTVQDEYGKIDINSAPRALLARLLYSLEIEPQHADSLADAIVDYRDKDEHKRLNGAEDEDYRRAKLAWESKDAHFTRVAELQRVFGMTDPIYRAIAPHVTVHSKQKGVNHEVAPLQVLMAISEDSPASLQQYIEQRRSNHWAGLPKPAKPQIHRQYQLNRRGSVYTIQARGETDTGGQSSETTTIRIRRSRNGPEVKTLDWQPYILAAFTKDDSSDSLSQAADGGD